MSCFSAEFPVCRLIVAFCWQIPGLVFQNGPQKVQNGHAAKEKTCTDVGLTESGAAERHFNDERIPVLALQENFLPQNVQSGFSRNGFFRMEPG